MQKQTTGQPLALAHAQQLGQWRALIEAGSAIVTSRGLELTAERRPERAFAKEARRTTRPGACAPSAPR